MYLIRGCPDYLLLFTRCGYPGMYWEGNKRIVTNGSFSTLHCIAVAM